MKKTIWILALFSTLVGGAANAVFPYHDIRVPFEVTYILPKKSPTVCDSYPALSDKKCCVSWITGSSDHSMCGACNMSDLALKTCCEAHFAGSDCPAPPPAGSTPGGAGATADLDLTVDCRADDPKDEAHQCSEDGIPCFFSMTKDPANPKKAKATPITCVAHLSDDNSSDQSATKAMMVTKGITSVVWKQTEGPQIGGASTGAAGLMVTGVTDLMTTPGVELHIEAPTPSNMSKSLIGVSASMNDAVGFNKFFTSNDFQGGGCGCNMTAPDDSARTATGLRHLMLTLGAVSLLWYGARRRAMRTRRIKGYVRGR